MEKPTKKQKTFLIILGVTGTVYGVFRFLLPLVAPFLAAWGLAELLYPSAEWLAGHLHLRIRLSPRFPFRRNRHCECRQLHIGISPGAVACGELLLILAMVFSVTCYGGRLLLEECTTLLRKLPDFAQQLSSFLEDGCRRVECGFHLNENVLMPFVQDILSPLPETIKKGAMPYLMTNSMSILKFSAKPLIFLLLTVISTGMLVQEYGQWERRIRNSVFRRELSVIISGTALVVGAYLKTQGILLLLISGLCTLTFWLIGNPYFILAGIGTGCLDALPFFGTGTILVPWAIFLFLTRRIKQGMILLGLYLVCYILREILEARWMSRQVGLSALENLISIFTGLKLLGIPGIFLGPLALLLIRDLVKLILFEIHS